MGDRVKRSSYGEMALKCKANFHFGGENLRRSGRLPTAPRRFFRSRHSLITAGTIPA